MVTKADIPTAKAILALIRGKRDIARLEGVNVSTVPRYAKNNHGGKSDPPNSTIKL